MISDFQLASAFSKPSFVGAILRYATFLEYDVDCLLTLYFSRSERVEDTLDLLLPELAFGRKLEILRRLPLKHTKSHAEVLKALRNFQRLRNLAAHSWTVSRAKARQLLQDPQLRPIFAQFPDSLDASFKVTRRRLTRLRQSKAFGPDARKASRDMDVRTLVKVMSNAAA